MNSKRNFRTWRKWLTDNFPATVSAEFSDRHVEFWRWVWAIESGQRPRPFVAIWPRGGGKSTCVELAVVALAVRGRRRYCMYVCETQAQADDHVAAIASKLSHLEIERKMDKYGKSQGWRRNRLRTEKFTVDALGLDVASRGKKIDDDRPDLIVFDDVDNQKDSPRMITKKKKTITSSILPAMAGGCAVLFVQNLIHLDSIAAQLVDGRADFLADRIVSGPHKAAISLRVVPVVTKFDETSRIRHVVQECVPTWSGQDATAIQEAIDTYGLNDFLQESQHEVDEREGALWTRARLAECFVTASPELKRIVVAVDPSGGSDDIGIIAAGIGYDDCGYVVHDASCKGRLGTLIWAKRATTLYHDLAADIVVAEANFGGDMVKSNITVADPHVPVRMVRASRGKAARAEPVASLYGDDHTPTRVFHVGVFSKLESEMTTWTPDKAWSPNRMDALVWALSELMLKPASAAAPQSKSGRRNY